MKLSTFASITAIVISLTACGGNKGGNSNNNNSNDNQNSETTTNPGKTKNPSKNGVSLPQIDPNRPKTGRGALLNVPWLLKDAAVTMYGITFRPYFYITENTLTATFLCGTKINGQWNWIKPNASSSITWGDNYFRVLETNTDMGTINGIECEVKTIERDFEYEIYDSGERMTLTVDGEILNMELFRDIEQGSRSAGDVSSGKIFSSRASDK